MNNNNITICILEMCLYYNNIYIYLFYKYII